jgi:hypothetical protein
MPVIIWISLRNVYLSLRTYEMYNFQNDFIIKKLNVMVLNILYILDKFEKKLIY